MFMKPYKENTGSLIYPHINPFSTSYWPHSPTVFVNADYNSWWYRKLYISFVLKRAAVINLMVPAKTTGLNTMVKYGTFGWAITQD